MADRFIDQDETQIYGPYAARRIRNKTLGLVPVFDPALSYMADQIELTTAAVKSAVDSARNQDAARRKGVTKKVPLLKQATGLLGRFSKHLDGHKKDTVDRKVFFTADGTAGGVGKGAANVLLAVSHIAGKLGDPDCGVSARESWLGEFTTMMIDLGPVVDNADDARTDRRDITPEVEAARQAWMQQYIAAREVVSGVLRQVGRAGRLSTIFYDLAVPAGTKLTSIPDDADLPDDDDLSEEADTEAPAPPAKGTEGG